MTVNETVKECLLGYPTLFSNRIAVLKHLFSCIGNGYEWENGELVSVGRFDKRDFSKMDYSDLREDRKRIKKGLKHECLRDLNNARLLENKLETYKRKLIEKNIDLVVREKNLTFRRESYQPSYYLIRPCFKYAYMFNFPDDINKDWAAALVEFGGFWVQNFFYKNNGFPCDDKYKTDFTRFDETHKKDWAAVEKIKKSIAQLNKKFGWDKEIEEREKQVEAILEELFIEGKEAEKKSNNS